MTTLSQISWTHLKFSWEKGERTWYQFEKKVIVYHLNTFEPITVRHTQKQKKIHNWIHIILLLKAPQHTVNAPQKAAHFQSKAILSGKCGNQGIPCWSLNGKEEEPNMLDCLWAYKLFL